MTLMMTVSGVRGLIGQTMTPPLAAELGMAFGSYLGGGAVVIGRDSRPSGHMLSRALSSGLVASGCHVIDLGVVSTPGVAVMVQERQAAGGVVITASHNPAEWNGIKFLTGGGFAPPPEDAARILERYRQRDFLLADVDHLGRIEKDDSTHARHVQRILRLLDVAPIRRKPLTVVLDSVNGAGGLGGHLLLEKLGCQVIPINAEANGQFAHPPEPTEDHLSGLCEVVQKHEAEVGFAQDPDADRLAIVDDRGRYIGEEYTLALAAKYMFARQPGPAAANLSTSRMIDDLAAAAGGLTVYRTPVGEANVARAMREHHCVIGGEGNGGVIDPRVSYVRDSFVAMGMVLNILAREDRPLSAIVDDLPRYVMVKRKFSMTPEQIAAWLRRVPEVVGDGRLNTTDGVRIDWPEGWVHVRGSNTEPIARVIAEAADAATANSLVQRVASLRE